MSGKVSYGPLDLDFKEKSLVYRPDPSKQMFLHPAAPPSYIIFQEDGLVKAKNGLTGKIDFSGTDASTVIQSALNALTPNRTWKEKVLLKGNFVINSPISVPSYTILETFGRIKLADQANCYMLKNSDFANGNIDIEILGGVWDGNGVNQTRNPVTGGYWGHPLYFRNVSKLKVKDILIQNPNAWCLRVQQASDVYLHNISLSCPGDTKNEDGIDILGPASNIIVDGVFGVTKDNTIALFPDADASYPWSEGVKGNISNVIISNVSVKDVPYELIRFYSGSNAYSVTSVSISDVVGYNVGGLIGSYGSCVVYRCAFNGAVLFLGYSRSLFYFERDMLYDFNLENILAYGKSPSGWGSTASLIRPSMKNVRLQIGDTFYYSDKTGTATFSGDGTTTQFTIPHGLAGTPKVANVTPASSDAKGSFYVTTDATNIYVNYATAPPAGTNNVVLYWSVSM